MSSESGAITLPRQGLKAMTSRGYQDGLSLASNFRVIDQVAGSINEYRFLDAFNPLASLPVADTWVGVAMPNPTLAALGVIGAAEFDGVVRFSNAYKVLCARFRVLHAGGGVATAGLHFQLRKGTVAAAPLANELLIGAGVAYEGIVTVQNLNRQGREAPGTPVLGMDQSPVSLWMKRDAAWILVAAVQVEVIITAQLLPEVPPEIIIEV